jgi:phage recombination protein Bet
MTQALTKPQQSNTPQKPSALALMAARLSVEPAKLLTTLKDTVFQKATDSELLALTVVANEYGLNPFLKEIYAFPAKGGGIVPIVSVDGWNKMLVRHPDFDGIEFDFAEDSEGHLVSCTATVHLKNRSHPVKVTEYLAECKRNTDPWNNMPRRMLRNRTLCQASRMACGFSGVYNEEEAATVIDVSSSPVASDQPAKLITAPESSAPGPQKELEALLVNEGITFAQFRDYVASQELVKDADSLASYDDLASDDAKRLLRAKTGLVTNIKKVVTPAQ